MDSALFAKGNSLVPHTGVDFSDKEGYLVKTSAGVPAVNDSATVPATMVCLEGNVAAKNSTLAVLGATPPVRLKASGADGKKYDRLKQVDDGTVEKDDAAGARVVVAVALEDYVADQLVLAQPITPDVYSA